MNSKRKIFLINLIFGVVITFIIIITISSYNLELVKIDSNLEITDLIAVSVISAFVMGTSFILGVNLKQTHDYYFNSFKFSTKYQILIFGGMYVLYAIYIISVYFRDISVPLFLLIPPLLILQGFLSITEFEFITLKMVTFNEQGSKKIETRNELELYDTTDKDYRFKDSDGNEFIIPNNQVLEIIKKPNKVEENPMKISEEKIENVRTEGCAVMPVKEL